MQHVRWKTAGLVLILALTLVARVQAQQEHQQHHPGAAQAPQQQAPETSPGTPAQSQQMPGMMEHMQGMMEHMQGMMERMQGMMGHGGMRGRGGMMGRQSMGMAAQEEQDDEATAPQRGMMGMGGMMGHHMERMLQELELTDVQQAQMRTLLRNHAKEAIGLRADISLLAVDIRQVLDTDPVDLPRVKPLLQSVAAKEADLRFAHLTLMQEVKKLLTPEQQKTFRTMREGMMGMGGMTKRRGMMGMGGMMGRGRGER